MIAIGQFEKERMDNLLGKANLLELVFVQSNVDFQLAPFVGVEEMGLAERHAGGRCRQTGQIDNDRDLPVVASPQLFENRVLHRFDITGDGKPQAYVRAVDDKLLAPTDAALGEGSGAADRDDPQPDARAPGEQGQAQPPSHSRYHRYKPREG